MSTKRSLDVFIGIDDVTDECPTSDCESFVSGKSVLIDDVSNLSFDEERSEHGQSENCYESQLIVSSLQTNQPFVSLPKTKTHNDWLNFYKLASAKEDSKQYGANDKVKFPGELGWSNATLLNAIETQRIKVEKESAELQRLRTLYDQRISTEKEQIANLRKQINKDYLKLYTEFVKDEDEEERLKKLEERRSK
jgi:hypothetical protein